jgi:hypothetical protein
MNEPQTYVANINTWLTAGGSRRRLTARDDTEWPVPAAGPVEDGMTYKIVIVDARETCEFDHEHR